MEQVRCDHCGWSNNPVGAKKCQKCNQDLVYQPAQPEVVKNNEPLSSNCRNCGYPLTTETSFCPNCGTASGIAVQSSYVDPSMKRTVRDLGSVSEFSAQDAAQPIAPQVITKTDVTSNLNSVSFRLKPIDVNNTERFAFGNDVDASFEFVDGQWFITDNSGTNSAYVCASRRISLQKGDVVLIGGRRYLFE